MTARGKFGTKELTPAVMNALRQHDWLRLQEFLLRLHTASNLAELPATILGGLGEVIPFDSGSLQDDRGGLREIPWLFEEQAWQPEIGAGDELGVRVMVALCRESPDFSERDRSLLEMLRPHLATAWRQAWEGERQRAEVKRLLGRKSQPAEAIAVNVGLRKRLGITPREAEVLGWVAQGKTNREIAIILGLAVGTVKFYVERILAKLGCETRTAAARTVLEAATLD